MKVDFALKANICSFTVNLLTITFFLGVFSQLLLVYNVLASCQSEELTKTKDSCETGTMSNCQNNALAVVLYEESSILPMHKQKRVFRYVNHDISIQQDWAGLGVAAVVWDAAEILCEYLVDHPDIVRGKTVLELGAGTGLVGIVAVLLGGSVTITDRGEVLQFLEKTVTSNLPSQHHCHTRVAELDWTNNLAEWEPKYDVIVGADIVYIEEVFEDLLRTLRKLTNAKTLVLLSCRIRYDRDTNFLAKLEEDFVVENILYDKVKDVNLYKVLRR